MPNNHTDRQPRSPDGKFITSTPRVEAEAPAPDDPCPVPESLNITGLEPYRKVAAGLKEAFGRVKAIGEEQAFLAQSRATALARQEFLEKAWIETEGEDSVSELANLGSRVHLFDAKARALEKKLAVENFMAAAVTERIMEFIDDSCQIEARGYVLDVARMSKGVVQARQAQVQIEAVNEVDAARNGLPRRRMGVAEGRGPLKRGIRADPERLFFAAGVYAPRLASQRAQERRGAHWQPSSCWLTSAPLRPNGRRSGKS
jgi:hypothetical protein